MIEAFGSYLKVERNMSKHTLESYMFDLNQCLAFLQAELDVSFDNAKIKELRYWIVYLSKQDYSPRSINRKIAALKSFYKFAVQTGLLTNNPSKALKSLKTEKKLPEFYSAQELDDLFTQEGVFENSFFGRRDRLMLLVLFTTGIRQSELINIKISDLDLDRNQLKVIGKRNKERMVFLTQELKDSLITYMLELKSNNTGQNHSLFLTNKHNKMYPKFVYRKVNHYLSFISKGRQKSPHTLRHSFATELMNNEVEINSIKEVLGHASLSATEVYTHNSKERMIKEYKSYHPRGGNKIK